MSSAAVGGEPARASRRAMLTSPRERAVRRDVAEAEGEERGSADVEVGVEVGGVSGVNEGTADGVIDEGESEDHDGGPDDEKKNERERTVVAEDGFALAGMVEAASKEDPGVPGGDVKEGGGAGAR